MPRKKQVARFEGRLGVWPLVVWYGERLDKGGVCYTRTWSVAAGNWKWESCRMRVRDASGQIDPEAQAKVIEIAKRRHDLVTGRIASVAIEDLPPIRVRDTWALIAGEDGRFPTKTPYRDELAAGIRHVAKVHGGDFAWMHMDEPAFTRVLRDKVKTARARKKADGTPIGNVGFRAAIQTGTSIITIMTLLRELKRLPPNLALPGGRRWREDLRRFVTDLSGGIEPAVKRPRYALEELRALHRAALQVDPRFALLFSLGAEIRLGQVARARRSSLDLARGIFTSPGRGGKKGTVQVLTKGQLAAIDRALTGYLAPLEAALPDYPLFPQGRLFTVKDQPGVLVCSVAAHGDAGFINKRTIHDWFRAAETIAQIAHVPGRSAYGVKRVSVDLALAQEGSEDALLELGGWTTDRMPKTVYRDPKKDAARVEAAGLRAIIRGESVGESAGEIGTEKGPENVAESYPGTPKRPNVGHVK